MATRRQWRRIRVENAQMPPRKRRCVKQLNQVIHSQVAISDDNECDLIRRHKIPADINAFRRN